MARDRRLGRRRDDGLPVNFASRYRAAQGSSAQVAMQSLWSVRIMHDRRQQPDLTGPSSLTRAAMVHSGSVEATAAGKIDAQHLLQPQRGVLTL
jgi:hypothetical protein